MFESDDFDEVLSQFDIPGECNLKEICGDNILEIGKKENVVCGSTQNTSDCRNKLPIGIQSFNKETCNSNIPIKTNSFVSPKHTKRKIINSFFDHKSKRKFPGPAGLLSDNLEEPKDETICHIELLSQDINSSQNYSRRDLFDSAIWSSLLKDVKHWNMGEIDTIKKIKQQALAGNLRRRKAQMVTAFIEAVDRSVTDPLIILQDITGNIKCTLHRDAWSTFSSYVVSEYCALVLWKPTVLTTGGAFKKHYLNITLSNIFAIYSSAIVGDETDTPLPEGYERLCEENITVIKRVSCPQDIDTEISSNFESTNGANDLFDDLDDIFSSELF